MPSCGLRTAHTSYESLQRLLQASVAKLPTNLGFTKICVGECYQVINDMVNGLS